MPAALTNFKFVTQASRSLPALQALNKVPKNRFRDASFSGRFVSLIFFTVAASLVRTIQDTANIALHPVTAF